MLPGDDVVDLEGSIVGRLGHLAVFAAALGTLPDQSRECRVHGWRQEAVRGLSLMPRVRRALDFRIDSRVAALPKACISSFSAGVRVSSWLRTAKSCMRALSRSLIERSRI